LAIGAVTEPQEEEQDAEVAHFGKDDRATHLGFQKSTNDFISN